MGSSGQCLVNWFRTSFSFRWNQLKAMTSSRIAKSLSSTIKLIDGFKMPLFGLGTYNAKPDVCEGACLKALSEGYRMIDTAQSYFNETEVGNAVRNSGLKREDVFVVSKIHWDNHGTGKAGKAIEESLKKLNIGYIDLYLIHTPQYGKVLETYDEMVKFQNQKRGLIKSIGVSNFGIQHLEGLKEAGLPTPAVNQIEIHPWWQRKDLVQYCLQNGITVMGYSPLGKGHLLGDERLIEISKRYNKSTAQLMIRWSVQKGHITIPKSIKPERIVGNAQVFDFTISDEDMAAMDFKDQASCPGSWQPVETPWIQ